MQSTPKRVCDCACGCWNCVYVFFCTFLRRAGVQVSKKSRQRAKELQHERARYISQRRTAISWAYVRPIYQNSRATDWKKNPSQKVRRVGCDWHRGASGRRRSDVFSHLLCHKNRFKGIEKMMRGADDTEETWGECVRKCDMSWDFSSAGENCPWSRGRNKKIKKNKNKNPA